MFTVRLLRPAVVGVLALAAAALGPGLVAPAATATAATTATTATTGPSSLVRAPALAAPVVPAGSSDEGALPSSQAVHFEVALAPSDPSGLNDLLRGLDDPSSPEYQHWLAPGQFQAEFGPSSSEVAATEAWLRGRGITDVSASGFAVSATAPASSVTSALGTPFHRYRSRAGQLGFSTTEAPLVPQTLVGSTVQGIVGLNTTATLQSQLAPAVPSLGASPDASSPAAQQLPAPGTGDGLTLASTPTCDADSYGDTLNTVGAAYGLNSLLSQGQNGHGQTIALYELGSSSRSDVNTYEHCFGLTGNYVVRTVGSGGTPSTGGTEEADADIEDVMTAAPGASVISYEGPDDGDGLYNTWSAIVSDDLAQLVSSSWGACEADSGATAPFTTLFEQAATQGQTVLVASGDAGAEACLDSVPAANTVSVSYPASDPWVTAVGGTTLANSGAETVWNDCQSDESIGCANQGNDQAAGGGGVSMEEPPPPGGQPEVTACTSCLREVPDLSANAGTPMAIFTEDAWGGFVGTSLSAPLVAGLLADKNTGCAAATGLFTTPLYSLYDALSSDGRVGSAFADITSGNNDMTGANGGKYAAGPGYDLATGVGSPIAAGLSCPEITSVSPASAAAGATVTVTGLGLETAAITFDGVPATVVPGTTPTAMSATVKVPVVPVAGPTTIGGNSVLGTGTTTSPFTFVAGALNSGQSTISISPTSVTADGTTAATVTVTAADANGTRLDAGGAQVEISLAGGSVGTLGPVVDHGNGTYTATVVSGSTGQAVVTATIDGAVVGGSPPATAAVTFTAVPPPPPPPGGSTGGSSSGGSSSGGSNSGGSSSGGSASGGSSSGGSAAATASGYDMVGADGGVFVFAGPGQPGGFFGSLPGLDVHVDDVVGMVPSSDDRGYFLVGSDGGVFAFGDGSFEGSLPGVGAAVDDVVGIVPTSDDRGYFLVGADGGVFAFGDAPFLGSLPGDGVHVSDVIGIAATPDDQGYWVVEADGTVTAFGDAPELGSVTASPSPVSAIAATPDGKGYWVVTRGGGVYAFGDANSFGSLAISGISPAEPIIGLVPTADQVGYWLIGADGGIFAYGDATFEGSLPGDGVAVTDVVGAVPTRS